MIGSVLGAPPFMALCRPEVRLDLELLMLGRLRKVRHALVFRQRSSDVELMVLR